MFTRRLNVSLKYCSCQQLADHVINEKDNRMLKLFEHNNRNFICTSSEHVCLLPSAYNVPGNIHDVQLRCVRLVICKSLLPKVNNTNFTIDPVLRSDMYRQKNAFLKETPRLNSRLKSVKQKQNVEG